MTAPTIAPPLPVSANAPAPPVFARRAAGIGSVVVVKIGGAALDDPARRSDMARDVLELRHRGIGVVIVHGGGPQITREMELRGVSPTFVGGRRVTDADTLAITQHVLLGSLAPALVASLGDAGVDAVSVSGGSASLLKAQRVEGLGYVGEITSVRAGILSALLHAGLTPAVACLARSEDGETLNVNADEVAAAIALSLRAHSLLFVTDVPGVLADPDDAGSLLHQLDSHELERLIPQLGRGMVAKAASALHAVRGGVPSVSILDAATSHGLLLQVIAGAAGGTRVTL